MTAKNPNDTSEQLRELINAKESLHELANLTPDGLPEDAGIANGFLLKMVAHRLDAAIVAYMCAAEKALEHNLKPFLASEG